MAVAIYSIESALGDETPIAALRAAGVPNAELVRLAATGLVNYRRSGLGLLDLATAAARATLTRSGLRPDSIDALLFLTCSHKHPEFGEEMGGELVRRLGVTRAHLLGLCLQGCAGLIAGLTTARAMVSSGHCRHVLLIVADKICDTGVPRVMPNAVVHSDGASSCVVSGGPGRYRLGEAAIVPDCEPPAGPDSAEPPPERRRRYAARAAVEALRRNDLAIGDVDLVVTNNLNQHHCAWLARALGVEYERVYGGHLGAIGHCLASDILISLGGLDAGVTPRGPGAILLCASSQTSHAAMVVTTTGDLAQGRKSEGAGAWTTN